MAVITAELVDVLQTKPVEWVAEASTTAEELAQFLGELSQTLEDKKLPAMTSLNLSASTDLLNQALALLPRDFQIPFKTITLMTAGNDLTLIGQALSQCPPNQKALKIILHDDVNKPANLELFKNCECQIQLSENQRKGTFQWELNLKIAEGQYQRSRDPVKQAVDDGDAQIKMSVHGDNTTEYENEIEQEQEQQQELSTVAMVEENKKLGGALGNDQSDVKELAEICTSLETHPGQPLSRLMNLTDLNDKIFTASVTNGQKGLPTTFFYKSFGFPEEPKNMSLATQKHFYQRMDALPIQGASKNARTELWRRRDQLVDTLDANHLPAGFYLVGENLYFDAALERQQANQSNVIQPISDDKPMVNAFFLKNWLDTHQNTNLAKFCKNFLGPEPYEPEAFQMLQGHFVKLVNFNDQQLTDLGSWVLPGQSEQMDFILAHIDWITATPDQAYSSITREELLRLFPNKTQAELVRLTTGLQNTLGKVKLSKHPLLMPLKLEFDKKIVDSLNHEAVILLVANQGEEVAKSVLSQLSTLDPVLQSFFTSQQSLESLLDSRSQEALTFIGDFSEKEKAWFLLLLKSHVQNFKNDDLLNLVKAFQSFSSKLKSEMGLKDGKDFAGVAPTQLIGVKSLPAALNRMTDIILNAQENARAAQWEEMPHLDLSATGAIVAVREYNCQFVAREAKYTEDTSKVNSTDYSAPKVWKADINVELLFWRYVGAQPEMAPLSFYRGPNGALSILDRCKFAPEVHAGMLELLARSTTGASVRNKSEPDLLQEWEAVCRVLSMERVPGRVKTVISGQIRGIQNDFIKKLLSIDPLPDLNTIKVISEMVEKIPEIAIKSPWKAQSEIARLLGNVTDFLDTLQCSVGLFDIKINDTSAVLSGARFFNTNMPTLVSDPEKSPLFHYAKSSLNEIRTAVAPMIAKYYDRFADANEEKKGDNAYNYCMNAGTSLLSVFSTFHLERIPHIIDFPSKNENAADGNDEFTIVATKPVTDPKIEAILENLITIYSEKEKSDASTILEKLMFEIVNNDDLTIDQLGILVGEFKLSFENKSTKEALKDFSEKLAEGQPCHFLNKALSAKALTALTNNVFGRKPPEAILKETELKFGKSAAADSIKAIITQHVDGSEEQLNQLISHLEKLVKLLGSNDANDLLMVLNKAYGHGLVPDLGMLNKVLDQVINTGNASQFSYILTHPDFSDKTGLLHKVNAFYETVRPWYKAPNPKRNFSSFASFSTIARLLLKTPLENMTEGVVPSADVTNPFTSFKAAFDQLDKQNLTVAQVEAFLNQYNNAPELAALVQKIRLELNSIPKPEVPKPVITASASAPPQSKGFFSKLFGRASKQQEIEVEPVQATAPEPKLSQMNIGNITEAITVEETKLNNQNKSHPNYLTRLLNQIDGVAARNPQIGRVLFAFIDNLIKVTSAENLSVEINQSAKVLLNLANSMPKGGDELGALLLSYEEKPLELMNLLNKVEELCAADPNLKVQMMLMITKMSNIGERISVEQIIALNISPDRAVILNYYNAAPYPKLEKALSWTQDRNQKYDDYLINPNGTARDTFSEGEPEKCFTAINSPKININADSDLLRKLTSAMATKSPTELKQMFDELKRDLKQQPPIQDYAKLLAVIAEILYRNTGDELNSTQFAAVLTLLKGGETHTVMGMGTGEGKSRTTMVTLACLNAMGKTVDFVTADMSLVARDYYKHKPFFEALDIKTGMIYGSSTVDDYKQDGINFSDASNLSLFRNSVRAKGKPEDLAEILPDNRALVADEIDELLYDSTEKGFNIAKINPELAKFDWIYEMLMDFVSDPKQCDLVNKKGLFFENPKECLRVFKNHIETSATSEQKLDFNKLLLKRPKQCQQWLSSAVKAQGFKEGTHYTIETDVPVQTEKGGITACRAVVTTKGRKVPGASYSLGVQQCLHAKLEKERKQGKIKADTPFVKIPEKRIIYTSGVGRLLRDYKNCILWGLTGTPGSAAEREEMKESLNMEFFDAPRHLTPLRQDLDVHIRGNKELQNQQIRDYLNQARANNQPMVLFCKTDEEAKDLFKYFEAELKKTRVVFDKDQNFKLTTISKTDPVIDTDSSYDDVVKGRTDKLKDGEIKVWQKDAESPYSFMAKVLVKGQYRIVHGEFEKGFTPTSNIIKDILEKAEEAYHNQFLQRISAENTLEQEAQLIQKASLQGMITIATPAVARGTDYKPNIDKRLAAQFEHNKELAAKNGLGILVNYLPSERDENQFFGRAGRWGAPGSARLVLNAEDLGEIATQHGLKHKNIFRAQKEFIALMRTAFDHNARLKRMITNVMRDHLDEITDRFFDGLQSLEDDEAKNTALDHWDDFLNAASNSWKSTWVDIEAVLKTDLKEQQKGAQINHCFEAYNKVVKEAYQPLKKAMPALANDPTEIKLHHGISLDKGHKQTIGFKPLRASKFETSHIGKFVKYDSSWERWRATLSGERKLFANSRAAWNNEGERFLELKAIVARLKEVVRNSLKFGPKEVPPAPSRPTSTSG